MNVLFGVLLIAVALCVGAGYVLFQIMKDDFYD